MLQHELVEVFAEQWLGAVDAAGAHDCDFICFCGSPLDERGLKRQAAAILDLPSEETLDGLVVWTSTLAINVGRTRLERFCRRFSRLPIVSVEDALGDAPVVLMQNRQGMRAAVSHLIEVHGRRRIAFVRGPATHVGAEERYQGYLEALAEHGLRADPQLVSAHPSGWNPEEAADAVTRMLGNEPPDAIAAANDDFAVGVLFALSEANVRTPDDVSVVGFDDITNIRSHDLGFDAGTDDETGAVRRAVNIDAGALSLTTVRAPFHEMGWRAVELVAGLIRGEKVPQLVTVPTQLVVRRSCGCFPMDAAQPATEGDAAKTTRDGPAARLEAALSDRSAVLPEDWAAQLSEAFIRDVQDDSRGDFLPVLDRFVQASLRSGENLENWWRALFELRQLIAHPTATARQVARAAVVCSQAQSLVHSAAERQARYQSVLAEKRNQIVRDVGQRMVTAPDTASLAATVAEELPKIGITSCYLALYEPAHSERPAGAPTEMSRLLLAYENGTRTEIGAAETTYPSVQLLPGDRLANRSPYSMVATPLYFKDQQLGFALFALGPRIGWIYATLQEQVSSALHRARMVERERRALTAAKDAEAALHRAHAELEMRVQERTAQLARTNDVLTEQIMERRRAEHMQASLAAQLRHAQKMEAVGRLAGGVAHDFNNLLLVINGNSDALLRRADPDDPSRPELEDILHAGERAANLTRQLLAFSRQQVLHPRALNVNDVIGSIEEMLRRLIGEDVQLSTRLLPSLALVWADAGQLEQIIFNLAVNARDAMPDGGELLIDTDNVHLGADRVRDQVGIEPGPHVVLRVRDTGVGMDEAIQSRLFEPFFTTKPPGKGTGLGLATVFGIVQQSGGHIVVNTAPDKGTTFEIYFPQMRIAAPETQESEPSGPSPSGTETILLVEDNAYVRAAACRFLTAYGYRVLEAVDGRDALRVCDDVAGELDLVITDVVMPGMGGRELAEHLRRLCPAVPVLFISGYADSDALGEDPEATTVDLLQKPFAAETLVSHVRGLLDAGGTSTDPAG
jgi:signal transduction histidine kinase/DNA-binding LacI/PurR family transcriptional regulator